MTVGDKIRNMDDYELASYLTDIEMKIIKKMPTMTREAVYFEWLELIQGELVEE